MIPRLLLVLVLCIFSGCHPEKTAAAPPAGYEPRAGDFVFQSLPHDPLVDAIEGSSGSPFSHCGIVKRSGGQWVVIEAIGPVKETTLSWWIAQGREGAFTACRLREPLAQKIPAIISAAEKYEGRPYDIHYDMDDEKIYCSELLYKAVRDATGRKLGKIRKLGELNWQPYEQVIRHIENGKLPLDREMITPRDFCEAPELQQVFRSRM
jgi:Permuted papain-like amidase enzyme, YaeF/YiiX, C92 family